MSEYGTRTEQVRYRLSSGALRAVFSRYIDGAGAVFDLPVPYRYDRVVRTVAHEVIDPYALDGIVIDHLCGLVEKQAAEILWTRPGLLLDDVPVRSPRPAFAIVVNQGRGESYDIDIGPGSSFANPYSYRPRSGFIRVATPDGAVAKYRPWLWRQIRAGRITISQLAALHGQRLGGYDAPRPCHGDVLVYAAAWAHAQHAAV